MSGGARPAVEQQVPPPALLKVVNALFRTILQSRLHRPLSKDLMLLHVRGRKSGRVYVVPVGRHEHHGQLVASAGGTWRRNLEGGAPLDVTLDGRRRPAYGELVTDPDEVATVFQDLLAARGPKGASRLGLKINVHRPPTQDELREGLRGRHLVRLRLADTDPAAT